MENYAEWIENVKKKIRYMTNNIWDGINTTDVDSFISNFDNDDSVVGWVLLDMLIYYSVEQEEKIIEYLVNSLFRDILIKNGSLDLNNNSETLYNKIKEIKKEICFVPVDDSDYSASTFSLTTQFKKNEIIKNIEFIDLNDLPIKILQSYKYIVFYDDVIGTGNQFVNFWNENRFGKNNQDSLRTLLECNKDINIYYLVLAGSEEGIKEISKNICISVIASEIFSESYSVLSNDNEYWELNPDKKDKVIKYIKRKENEFLYNSNFTKNLPLLFQRSRANNTALSLYWNDFDGKWIKLYSR